ncbi:MarR family winged helix-turn-helix transcriptional regulator [Deinococcus sp.]|uniref:MarR family winged helix-turn-helix transcriptional regulator n=1 Tax=Deinococcus sp. TaxID=47478 RepID=UPI003B5CCD1D
MKTLELIELIARDWAAARPDLNPAPMLTVISVNRVSDLLERRLERFFADFELTPSSYDVLATLRRSAPAEGLSFSRLSELMAITPPAVTKRVDILEARGLVERTAHTHDRRASLVRLTPTGLALVDRILPLHLTNEERLLSGLTEPERLQLRTLLGQLAAHLEDGNEPS